MARYNNLKATLAITKASLLATTRNPSSVVFGLVFPLIFILVFGFIGNNQVTLQVAVPGDIDKGNPIYEQLDKMDNVDLVENKTSEEIKDDLEKGRLDGFLNIERVQIGDTPSINVSLQTTSASRNSPFLESTIKGLATAINLQSTQITTLPINVESSIIEGREFKSIDFILPGQLGFSLLSTGVFATSFLFISLKQSLVIKRFFATPVNRFSILAGEGLSRLIFAMIQSMIIITVGVVAFQYTLINGFETFLTMLFLSALGLIIFLGLGFIISSIAKNEDAVPPIANLVTLPQFLLAGTFFPIEAFPEWLQPVSKILPLTYLNDAMRKVAFEGANLSAVAAELIALMIMGVIIYVIAFKIFKWE